MLEWWLADVERTAEKLRGEVEDLPRDNQWRKEVREELPRLDSIDHAKEINDLSDRYLPKVDNDGNPKGWGSNPFGPKRPPSGRKGQKDRPETLVKRGAVRLVNAARDATGGGQRGRSLNQTVHQVRKARGHVLGLPARGGR